MGYLLNRYFFNKTFAIFLSIVILVIASLIFFSKLANISLPPDFEKFESEKIGQTSVVYFNQFGIPHITTGSEKDAFFMIGYTHARDRLWQMDLMRRTAKGELSEIFGGRTVQLDKFFRSLAIKESSGATLKQTNKKIMGLMQSYSDGVNLFITEHKKKLPFEFHALDYIPENWQPLDCIAIGRLMAFNMSPGFVTDICLAEISETVGVTKALSLVPDYPLNKPCITDNDFQSRYTDTTKLNNQITTEIFDKSGNTGLYSHLSDFYRENNFNATGGSNSWVIRKNVYNSSVILANDPHLQLELPSRWYQMHVSCPGFNIVGLTIPGIPFFIIGRNNYISWGISVMMNDDVDFFIERIDEKNPDYYLTPTGKRKFNYIPDTINVKNQERILYYLKETERSYVVSDNFITRFPENLFEMSLDFRNKQDFFKKFVLTYSWTGNRPSSEMESIYGIMKSRTWNDFTSSLNGWGSPGINWTFADKNGNMGIRPAGLIPVRKATNPLVPNPGWLPEYDWQGFISVNQLPYIYNPRKGYVSSANNKTSRDYPVYISNYFEPSSRAERIEEIILQQKEFTVREVQLMQSDNSSPYAKELLISVIPILDKKIPNLNATEKKSLQMLKQWDFQFSPGFASASIYSAFFKNLVYNTFYDELNEKLFKTYTNTSSFVTMKILSMIKSNDSVWFDNVNTKFIENRDFIVIKSFRDGVAELIERFKSTNPYIWRLKDLQKLELKHAFNKQPLIRGTVDFTPLQIGGNYTTINKNEWRVYDDYRVSIGASARFIADMQDSYVYMGIPGGASGDPMSPNYKDQVLLFLNSGYIKVPLKSDPSEGWKRQIEINPK